MADRNLANVITAMLDQIPISEEFFRSALESRLTSIKYTAPEAVRLQWHETAIIVNAYLPYPTQYKWQDKVAAIFAGEDRIDR